MYTRTARQCHVAGPRKRTYGAVRQFESAGALAFDDVQNVAIVVSVVVVESLSKLVVVARAQDLIED